MHQRRSRVHALSFPRLPRYGYHVSRRDGILGMTPLKPRRPAVISLHARTDRRAGSDAAHAPGREVPRVGVKG